MKKLDERKKGFEGKFARDQELEFKILARRNKYLGVWAAEKLGISGPAVEEYFGVPIKFKDMTKGVFKAIGTTMA